MGNLSQPRLNIFTVGNMRVMICLGQGGLRSLSASSFDCTGDPSNIGPRWEWWLNYFEIYADSKGLIIEQGKNTHKQRRRALLLHSAGQAVQDIYL